MALVIIRYWAAAKAAAGVPEETVEAVTLGDALNAVVARRKPGGHLADVIERSSYLVNASAVRRQAAESTLLDDGAVIEVLPPFAGG
jgi:molybdopterin synthase sulfur carrier subunit